MIVTLLLILASLSLFRFTWRCRECGARYEGDIVDLLFSVCKHPKSTM